MILGFIFIAGAFVACGPQDSEQQVVVSGGTKNEHVVKIDFSGILEFAQEYCTDQFEADSPEYDVCVKEKNQELIDIFNGLLEQIDDEQLTDNPEVSTF
jgi:hypothetical protein